MAHCHAQSSCTFMSILQQKANPLPPHCFAPAGQPRSLWVWGETSFLSQELEDLLQDHPRHLPFTAIANSAILASKPPSHFLNKYVPKHFCIPAWGIKGAQEAQHIGHQLFRDLPVSAMWTHVLVEQFSLALPGLWWRATLIAWDCHLLHLLQPAKLTKHVVTHYCFHLTPCLPPPTLGEWVVWNPPTPWQGHRHWPNPWGPAIAVHYKVTSEKSCVIVVFVGLPGHSTTRPSPTPTSSGYQWTRNMPLQAVSPATHPLFLNSLTHKQLQPKVSKQAARKAVARQKQCKPMRLPANSELPKDFLPV